MRSVGAKLAALLLLILLPLFFCVMFYTTVKEAENIERLHLEKLKILAQTGAASVSKLMEDAVSTEQLTMDQLFDTDYREIPNTDPKRYNTAYDDWADKNFRSITEEYLKDPEVVFAVPTDRNGYIPTHNLKHTEGDFSNPNNRTKRIFNDQVGLKAAGNTESYLQQEYKRDTGEIMWDGSAPIYVQGVHWGAFRIGYSDQFLKDISAMRTRTIVCSLFYALILIIPALFVGKLFTNPLKKIEKAFNLLAEGNLKEARVEHKSEDEFGRMVKTFNNMRVALQELIVDIKERNINLNTETMQLTANAQQGSAAATENASTVSEIAATVDQVVNNTKEVLAEVNQSNVKAANGQSMLNEMEKRMESVSSMAQGIVGSINDLALKISGITEITEIINQIAGQTNMLALNAAIEAARAGEAGRGFAVVADEVSKLAEKSANAAKEIMDVIKNAETETVAVVQSAQGGALEIAEGFRVVTETGHVFEEIIGLVENLSNRINEVQESLNQVNDAVQNIAANTEQQSATSQEVSASSEMLSKMAGDLQKIVEQFRV